jgi:predicted RNA-binding protein
MIRRFFCLPVLRPRRRVKECVVCDLKAYVRKNDKEELLLESVNLVRAEGEEVVLRNLFGEEKRVRGVLKEVSLVRNRLLVEQA